MLVLDFVDVGPAETFDARYLSPLGELAASEGGAALASYELDHLLTGRADQEWPHATLLQFSQADEVVQVMTSAPFRLLSAQADGRPGSRMGVFARLESPWRGAVIVWLSRRQGERLSDAFAPLHELLSGSDGRLVLDQSLVRLTGDEVFDRVVVMDFPNADTAKLWLRSAEVAAARVLLNAQVDDLATAVYVRRAALRVDSPASETDAPF